jgi:hypothetical protein
VIRTLVIFSEEMSLRGHYYCCCCYYYYYYLSHLRRIFTIIYLKKISRLYNFADILWLQDMVRVMLLLTYLLHGAESFLRS